MDDLLTFERYRKTPDLSGLIVTAIPDGRKWRLKAVCPSGSVKLPTVFASRLEALGAALLLSTQAGGRAVP